MDNKKYIPVVFDDRDITFIPSALRPVTRYNVSHLHERRSLVARILQTDGDQGLVATQATGQPEAIAHRRWLLTTAHDLARLAQPLPLFSHLVQHELQAFAFARYALKHSMSEDEVGDRQPVFTFSMDVQSHDMPGKSWDLPNDNSWPRGVWGGFIPLMFFGEHQLYANRVYAHSLNHRVWRDLLEWTRARARYLLALQKWLHDKVESVKSDFALELVLADSDAESRKRKLNQDGVLAEFFTGAISAAADWQWSKLQGEATTGSAGLGVAVRVDPPYLYYDFSPLSPIQVLSIKWGLHSPDAKERPNEILVARGSESQLQALMSLGAVHIGGKTRDEPTSSGSPRLSAPIQPHPRE